MQGHGYAPTPPPGPDQGGQVTLRVIFVVVAVMSCGLLAWACLLRLASVTRRPRDLSSSPSDAEAMPLPSDDTTPPVTTTILAMSDLPPRSEGLSLALLRPSSISRGAPRGTRRPPRPC